MDQILNRYEATDENWGKAENWVNQFYFVQVSGNYSKKLSPSTFGEHLISPYPGTTHPTAYCWQQ
jgi:hypothetical protein